MCLEYKNTEASTKAFWKQQNENLDSQKDLRRQKRPGVSRIAHQQQSNLFVSANAVLARLPCIYSLSPPALGDTRNDKTFP